MRDRQPAEPDPDRLPEQVATRLLTRASELDAAIRAGAQIAELRAAAMEAGISTEAFDKAVAELREGQSQVPAVSEPPRRRSRLKGVVAGLVALILFMIFAVARMATPSLRTAPAGAPMIEEVVSLRCLSGDQAAALIRPLLPYRTNSIVVSPTPGVLTITATQEQIQDVRALLSQYESGASNACPPGPAPK